MNVTIEIEEAKKLPVTMGSFTVAVGNGLVLTANIVFNGIVCKLNDGVTMVKCYNSMIEFLYMVKKTFGVMVLYSLTTVTGLNGKVLNTIPLVKRSRSEKINNWENA